ncbi:HNH endonuclease [Streptomyces sp. N35]|uniref:HNH endonuclease n=1 Tax=Streptomyces sp. N35 TaxID=2795730 RepID=UPI0018F7B09B|nr:HNH endonuclease [Streptomyces sp. N35]
MTDEPGNWPRPTLPGPLKAALKVLKAEGCALSLLDLARADKLLSDLGAPAPPSTLRALEQLHAAHAPLALLPDPARTAVLEDAHIVPWEKSRKGCASQEEARRRFHRWQNALVLCRHCHAIFDKTWLIPAQLIVHARLTALRTAAGHQALVHYLERSLAFRAGRSPELFGSDEAFAAHELHRLHGHGGHITVRPHLKKDRVVQSAVSPEDGLIRVGALGDDSGGFFFAYAITDVPPPKPTRGRTDGPSPHR